jgi:phosphatidylserine/phosphatidylglycerophosphate/cardiolipin synthase-like enzyme
MQYLKRNIKYSIFAFFIIILSITISISTLAKTEIYFSLYDNPQKEIIKNINQAEAFINIAMYIFTDKEIAIPLSKARERGVKVRVYLDRDQVDYKYSQSRFLVQKGINTRISSNNYIMHNKFAIIDNRLLLTGSYNWTFSANHRNDENLMVIDDPDIIEIFQNQFEKLWLDKYSAQRTRALYKKAKKNMPDALNPNIKPESRTININTASQAELVKVLKISEPLSQKIINLKNEINCFKEPKDLLKIPELTNLDLREWKEEGIVIGIN